MWRGSWTDGSPLRPASELGDILWVRGVSVEQVHGTRQEDYDGEDSERPWDGVWGGCSRERNRTKGAWCSLWCGWENLGMKARRARSSSGKKFVEDKEDPLTGREMEVGRRQHGDRGAASSEKWMTR